MTWQQAYNSTRGWSSNYWAPNPAASAPWPQWQAGSYTRAAGSAPAPGQWPQGHAGSYAWSAGSAHPAPDTWPQGQAGFVTADHVDWTPRSLSNTNSLNNPARPIRPQRPPGAAPYHLAKPGQPVSPGLVVPPRPKGPLADAAGLPQNRA